MSKLFGKGNGKQVNHGGQGSTGNQGNQGALYVTLPREAFQGGTSRTTEASSSRNSQSVGEPSNPNKRGRDDSVVEGNPEKRLEMDTVMETADPDTKSLVEVGNLTEEEIVSQIVQKVSLEEKDDTYSGVTKRPKLDLPDLVYIQKGTERREPIQKAHYDLFIDYLLENIFKLKADECAKVDIDWHGWGLGRGIVACQNPETAAFVKEVASSFKINGLSFKAWAKTEFGSRIIFSGRLAGICWQKRKPLETIKWIFNLNGLKNFEFYLISYLKTPQGILLRFEASKELDGALATRQYILNAGIAKLKLEKKVINSKSDQPTAINDGNADGNNSPKESAIQQS